MSESPKNFNEATPVTVSNFFCHRAVAVPVLLINWKIIGGAGKRENKYGFLISKG
jgi:hypothetical protein